MDALDIAGIPAHLDNAERAMGGALDRKAAARRLVYDACFMAGLRNDRPALGMAFRPGLSTPPA